MADPNLHDAAVRRAAEIFHQAPAGSISPIFDALVAAYEEIERLKAELSQVRADRDDLLSGRQEYAR